MSVMGMLRQPHWQWPRKLDTIQQDRKLLMIMIWWAIFGVPLFAAVVEWFVLVTHRRDQLRHITVVVAMLFSTASAFGGVWGLLQIEQMQRRAVDDFRYELVGLLLAAIAGFAALTWVLIERRTWLAWMSLVISGWMLRFGHSSAGAIDSTLRGSS